MISPNRQRLAALTEDLKPGRSIMQGTYIHPNPRFYKYLWQIYTADSPWENGDFWTHAPLLCTHDAMRMIETLSDAGVTHIVYNRRLPRRDSGIPINPASERWQGRTFAFSYDEDTDPVWDGLK